MHTDLATFRKDPEKNPKHVPENSELAELFELYLPGHIYYGTVNIEYRSGEYFAILKYMSLCCNIIPSHTGIQKPRLQKSIKSSKRFAIEGIRICTVSCPDNYNILQS